MKPNDAVRILTDMLPAPLVAALGSGRSAVYADKYRHTLTDVECEAVMLTARNAANMRKWGAAGQGRLL
jgi:D-arabinose 5-phosphate isomerase GutQ